MPAFPTTVATDADLYIAVNATSTQLTDNPLTAGATTVNVVSTTGFPTVGFISIDNEIIKYTGTTATSFTGCTRGADGTAATSHVQNSQVFHNVIAAHHNVLKDDLIATEQFISDLIGRTNTQVRVPNGSAVAPSYSFANDTDTGFFTAIGNIRMVVNGTIVATVNGAALTLNNAIIDVTDGSAAAPAFTFINDGDTGLYRVAANDLGVTIGGTLRLNINSTGLHGSAYYATQDGTAAGPIYSFDTDTDTGIFRSGTNTLNISAGGSSVAFFSPTGVGLRGTTTNNNATTGEYGEVLVSTTGNVPSPGTDQWFDLTSLSLTAGDWDVTIIAANNSTNYTACTDIEFGLGTSAGNVSPGATQMLDFVSMSWAGGHLGKINQTLTKRFSLSATTTVYAKALMTFTAGTQNGLCQLRARRIR